jgi:integrase
MRTAAVRHPVLAHLDDVRQRHSRDLQGGAGRVDLPEALDRRYPEADRALGWPYAFPSRTLRRDPRSGVVRRHHLDESTIQRAVQAAVRRAGLTKPASCHSFRHAFATYLLEDADVRATIIYTHVLNRRGKGVLSPLDRDGSR